MKRVQVSSIVSLFRHMSCRWFRYRVLSYQANKFCFLALFIIVVNTFRIMIPILGMNSFLSRTDIVNFSHLDSQQEITFNRVRLNPNTIGDHTKRKKGTVTPESFKTWTLRHSLKMREIITCIHNFSGQKQNKNTHKSWIDTGGSRKLSWTVKCHKGWMEYQRHSRCTAMHLF